MTDTPSRVHALAAWYREVARDLPWRKDADPWSILVSEVVLQQTQVSRGIEHHRRVMERFPDLATMARSEVDDVLEVWAGAGYYARGRRLHALAREVLAEHEGVLPHSASDLIGLPGIGPYTAAAVASIAHGEPVAVVDGNVRRVMARRTGSEAPSEREVRAWADDAMATAHGASVPAGTWNQAVMELGALICTPRSPACDRCPIMDGCSVQDRGLDPHRHPMPKPRRKRVVSLTAWVLYDPSGRPHLEQRPTNAPAYGGLWGPPLDVRSALIERLGGRPMRSVARYRHQLSHRDLRISIEVGDWDGEGRSPDDVPTSTLDDRILALALERRD